MEDSYKKAKILIVEDEQHINRLIELVLLSDGYHRIQKAYDGNEAFSIVKRDKPDLVLLDVMIPGIDGFTLCKLIKDDPELNSVQIIMLTAKNLEEDILKGFEYGAIDYISKPFSNKILLARTRAHLSNLNKRDNIINYKNLALDLEKVIVKIDDKIIDLTNFEFKILYTFLTNIGIVFSRSQLLSYLRGNDGFDVSERAVDVQIVNLRRKLGAFGSNIETIRGFGYKLKEL